MNMQNKNTIETNQNDLGLNPYQKFQEGTTEIVSTATTRRFKYLEGHPRQYRFDAKEGVFNINGAEKLGHTLTFQPIAWRIRSIISSV
jgi:hypothetical protein